MRDRLLRLIAKGELRPGERLNEAHLAESFGISRGPVREAARELEGQGFLTSRPNQGFYVTSFTSREIRDIYETKDWLEAAFIADLAAYSDVAERRAVLAEIETIDQTDIVAFSESLFQFRLRMSRLIHNRFLADLIVALYRKFYIVAAIVQAPDERGRQSTILGVLRRFWTAMSEGRIADARAIMADGHAILACRSAAPFPWPRLGPTEASTSSPRNRAPAGAQSTICFPGRPGYALSQRTRGGGRKLHAHSLRPEGASFPGSRTRAGKC